MEGNWPPALLDNGRRRALHGTLRRLKRTKGKTWATVVRAGGREVLVLSLEDPTPSLCSLTRSERGVVESVLRGESNADIARARGTSARTVANQIASAFRKLGVASRMELAAKVLRKSSTTS